MNFEALKDLSRRKLHQEMGFPAFYFDPNADPDDPPQIIRVRYHRANAYMGDVQGTNLRYAETAEEKLKIIVLNEELPSPVRGAMFTTPRGVGLIVDTVEPRDGITRTLIVVLARPDQIGTRPFP